MDRVLILDTETTGIDPEFDQCIEVGIVGYSLRHRAITECHSWLIQADSNDAEKVNKIPAGLLVEARQDTRVWSMVSDMAKQHEAILAHNADFDRQWLPSWWEVDVPWIDTCNGVTWPLETRPGANLIQLALEHGVAVVDPHRALSDCMLIARLLARCAEFGYDVEAILARGLRPAALFQAMVSYDDRQLAKDAGFRWNGDKKRWVRKMAIDDAKALPFRTVEVPP